MRARPRQQQTPKTEVDDAKGTRDCSSEKADHGRHHLARTRSRQSRRIAESEIGQINGDLGDYDSSLTTRRIAPSRRVLVCSPQYAQRNGAPETIEDIQQHDCICYGSASVAPYWQFVPQKEGEPPRQIVVRGRVHLNNGESMRDAAIAGLGIAALPVFIAVQALRDRKLIELLPESPPTPDTIYAVYPQTRYVSRAVRALIDMLAVAFEQAPPWERESLPAS